jgi:REP element-mobilizing transposase RayT
MNRNDRRSIRLKDYDYRQSGYYFVTLCVNDRRNLLGGIDGGRMNLNDAGKIVNNAWQWLGEQYEYVELDEFVVMPNHIHGIICIRRGGSRTAPTIKPLGRLVGAFKTTSTKQINIMLKTPGVQFWQRNYYEHIIRNDNELTRIREYILHNPAQWPNDRNNLENKNRQAATNVGVFDL